jgi:hypothetical protein
LGTWSKQAKTALSSLRAGVWSRTVWPSTIEPAACTEQGGMVRGSTTVNTTGSSRSVRAVATWVPASIWTGAGCTADSQKVTSALAAVAGSRATPISSRNLM